MEWKVLRSHRAGRSRVGPEPLQSVAVWTKDRMALESLGGWVFMLKPCLALLGVFRNRLVTEKSVGRTAYLSFFMSSSLCISCPLCRSHGIGSVPASTQPYSMRCHNLLLSPRRSRSAPRHALSPSPEPPSLSVSPQLPALSPPEESNGGGL